MVAFARFVMRDNGLAIHINADQVTQVRQTSEGDPAIYTLGRDTPMIVEGTLEAAIRKLEAATAGIRLVEPATEPEAQAAPLASPPVLELVAAEPTKQAIVAVAEPIDLSAETATVIPEKAATAEKTKPTKTKPAAKAKTAKVKTSKDAKAEAPLQPVEPPYPTASWFMGNR